VENGDSNDNNSNDDNDNNNNNNDNDNNKDSSFFDSKGRVAGVFTAVGIIALLLILAILWLLCFRKGKGNRDHDDDDEEMVIPADSDNTDSGVGRTGTYTIPPLPAKYRSSGSISPVSNGKFVIDEGELSSAEGTVVNEKHSNVKTHSRNLSALSTDYGTPIIDKKGDSTYVDQRLDVHPFTKFDEEGDILSLGDHQDYSRKVLKVTNP
jgi:hypothetical protein